MSRETRGPYRIRIAAELPVRGLISSFGCSLLKQPFILALIAYRSGFLSRRISSFVFSSLSYFCF